MLKSTKLLLIFLSITIIGSLLTLHSLDKREEKEFQVLNQATLLTQKLNSNTLLLRKHEKDFLSRKEMKYALSFRQTHQVLQQNITVLLDDLEHEKINTQQLIQFVNLINTYSVLFNQIILKQQRQGFHEKEGNHLNLRESAHKLLNLSKGNDTLLSDILMLRRYEKDFMLRHDLRYKELFIQKIHSMIKTPQNKNIKTYLNTYENSFIQFVQEEEKIGLHENQGLIGQMRKAVHDSEKLLSKMSTQLIRDLHYQTLELTKITHIFTLIIFFITILIISLLIKFFTSETKVGKLTQLNNELSKTLNELERTQDKLIEAEKMASLGGLVAGVAHEINTPLGIALTGITYFDDISNNLRKLYSSNNMTEEEFEKYLKTSEDISKQVLSNIKRASNLVQAFKQVSVDQTNEDKREFYVKDYTDGLILSVNNQIKKTKIKIENNISSDIKINSYPGAYGQIITNLILNSIIHGFTNEEKGLISINLVQKEDTYIFTYEDDGKGIEGKDLPHIFEPFFTTKRGLGGTGLGLNILYNIVRKQFNGHITCKSIPNKGVNFTINIPMD